MDQFATQMSTSRVESRAVPPWLERARRLLHEQSSSALQMREIAGLVGVHPVHLSRSFRQHFGVTMRGYLRGVRVRSACREMLRTDHPLSRIAISVGFSDHAHFTRAFKRVHGLTPTEYRGRGGAGDETGRTLAADATLPA